MDIRRRMLSKKKDSSSGGGSTAGGSYTVNLNSQWEKTTAITNPDFSLYDGVYRSSSNYNVGSGVAIMYITIKDCSSFKMYIRSYAESNYDYVMVSQLDKTITGSSSYSDTTLVKAHTRGNQQSGTALTSYTLVEYTGITSGEHTITVVYRKDGSVNSGDDRGYVLIEKSQDGSGDGGSEEEDIIPEPIINIDNYLTIEARENGLTASLSTNYCEYCVDGDGNWKSLSAGTSTKSINSGHTLSFRGELTPNSSKGIGTFTISKRCNLKGNCMSMLFGNNAANNYSLSGKSYAFYKLFYNCTNIVNVSSNFLSATTLAYSCYYNMFYGCTSLTTTPELPATTLARGCYEYMFYGCTSLATAPELPATTLDSSCYYGMFYGCTSLATAPELPATTLADSCYQYMFYGTNILPDCSNIDFTSNTVVASGGLSGLFAGTKVTDNDLERILPKNSNGRYYLPVTILTNNCYRYMFSGCKSLQTAPELPATTLDSSCYYGMFYGCTSLATAPELPATTLASYCYNTMFRDCSSLQTAPKLPATTLADSCYYFMFYNCRNLITAPELPATTLTSSCYQYMFYACNKLNYIKMLATNISATNCLDNWVNGVASNGIFIKNSAMTSLPTGSSGVPRDWTVVNDREESSEGPINIDNYLTIEALEDGLTASLSINACEYCVDGDGNWKSLAAGTATESINSGHTLSFRGVLTTTYNAGIGTFTINKECNLLGNCMSMLSSDYAAYNLSLSGKGFAFCRLFYNCDTIINVSSDFLPATTLAYSCYYNMFSGCTSLATAPELPATTLAESCYNSMFEGCTSLQTAPELPATTLASSCYEYMFSGCKSLQTAPELPATTLADSCYDGMFGYCTSLQTAPELPATTLASSCYSFMFRNCTNLNYIKMLATDISATNCLYFWVNGVASSGTFVKNSAMTSLPTNSSDGIPSGWTVQNA